MPLIRIKNETLIDKRESTVMTASAAAAATSVTVLDNSNFITNNDYYFVGKIGSETSEIIQNNASTTLGTNITFDGGGGTGGGLAFAHSVNTPVYRVDYNQFRLAHSTSTATGDIDNANIVTNPIQFDDTYTRYEEVSYTTGYYFIRFYNSTSTQFSDYSAPIPVGGHTQLSLWECARRVYKHLGLQLNDDMDESQVKFSEVRRALNDKQREIVHDRLWTFAEGERSFATVANQFRYVPDNTRVGIINSVIHDSKPLKYMDRATWELTHLDSDSTSSYGTHFSIWNNEVHIWPKPSSAASNTTMNDAGGISATDTSVIVTSASGFKATGGFYRFIIDSEVIYSPALSSVTFSGLLRGREGTTAATHSDGATVTERDIVYTYQVEPTDMVDITDETIVPEPDVLAVGAGADIARGLLKDNSLADRLDKKYGEGTKSLQGKYSKKVKTTFGAVKSIEDTVEGRGWLNPNDYPQDLT